MRPRFPWFVLLTGCACLLLALFRPATAQPPGGEKAAPGDAPKFPKAKVSLVAGGEPVEGQLKLTAVTLKTDIGTQTVLLSHVKKVSLGPPPAGTEAGHADSIQLSDKNVIRGHVTDATFVLQTDAGEKALPRAEVREIKVVNDAAIPLVALLLGLLTLTAMEIVLGVDNVIFLAIIAAKLPKEQQPKARQIGLAVALGTRLLLLFTLTWLLGLTKPLFTLPTFGMLYDLEAREVSLRDLILLVGGLFLIGKSTFEMHHKMEEARAKKDGAHAEGGPAKAVASFGWTIFTIAVVDIVFSLDSVITAVGMVEERWVMVVAMVIAMGVMLVFAGSIANFVDRNPTIKVLALSFLILIGVMLVAEGLGQHMDKGYIYVAMAFSLVVELINMQLRKPSAAPETPAQ
jgi:predicted tellurium resistance membrane protein TerC